VYRVQIETFFNFCVRCKENMCPACHKNQSVQGQTHFELGLVGSSLRWWETRCSSPGSLLRHHNPWRRRSLNRDQHLMSHSIPMTSLRSRLRAPRHKHYKTNVSCSTGEARQQDVYEATAQPLLQGLLNGYNATVFAHGVSIALSCTSVRLTVYRQLAVARPTQ
jgi:hypothetical protein